VPPRRVLNEEVATRVADLTASGIESRTGIESRFYASPDQTTSDLAVEASLAALRAARVDADAIDLILLATSTPDHLMPATACQIQCLLAAEKATAMDLAAACTGFIYALWVGDQFLRTGDARCVLVVGAEVMSRIVDPNDRQCAPLFGDGAGAAILTASRGPYRLGRFWGKTEGDLYPLLVRGGGTAPAEHLAQAPGGRYFLRMEGRRVYRAAVAAFCEAIEQTLAVNGLDLTDIDWIVPHQANQRMYPEVAAQLGINPEKFWCNIRKFGNTVAASIPIALEDHHRQVGEIPGSRILLVGVGAGMTSGGTVLYVD
jgi:3-oxoacyl-[acyl-carrier-protein] synthase-3